MTIMKKFVILLILAISYNIMQAQELTKKELKVAKRELESKKDSISGIIAKDAMEKGEWIFNATTITVSGGAMNTVPANLNFLMVEGEQFTFQTSTGFGGGPNNMGGITTTGLIKIESVDIDRHGNTSYYMKLTGSILNASATLNLQRNSNMADLYLNMDRGARNISMTGSIYPIGSTNVFEGSIR